MRIFSVERPGEYHEVPEGVCLLAYRGSIAHGMYIPNSDPNSIDDVDLMGVAIGSMATYFGLSEWGSRGTREYKEGKYDCVYYEIKKMFSLLLQGNPNVMSLLWLRPADYLLIHSAGRRIVENRCLFVGRHVYNAFAGYAHAQLEKMETRDPDDVREYLAVTAELKYRGAHPNHKGEYLERPSGELTGIETDVVNWGADKLMTRLRHFQKKGENIGYLGDKRKKLVLEHGFDAKNAAHCIRLLRMCKEFMATGEMTVYRPDAAELLDIKRGKWALSVIKQHAEELFADIRMARDASPLRPEPDRAGAEALLISILQDNLSISPESDLEERRRRA